MSNTIKAIMVASAVGIATGVSYAIYRSPGQKSDDTANIDTGPRLVPTKPPAGLRLPLPEPDHPQSRVRINRSHHRGGIVQEGAMELLFQAAKFDSGIDLDELTGARLAASEHFSGSFTELVCIIDAEKNRADKKGVSLFTSLTDGARFGKQGGKRPASTRLDPQMRHLLAARMVIRGEAAGISQGATRFYDPEAMEAMHAKYRRWVDNGRKGKKPPVVSCDALTLLEAWSFDYGKRGKSRCPPDRSRLGRHPLAWVGLIPGVDPLRLLLMKPMPRGAEHTRRYQAARRTLLHGLRGKAA